MRVVTEPESYFGKARAIGQQVPWRMVAGVGGFCTVLAGSVAGGIFAVPQILGHDQRQVPIDEQLKEGRITALSRYNSATDADKFAINYLRPITVRVDGSTDGKRFLGLESFANTNNVNMQVGQACLAGSAYDTRAVRGLRAPAAIRESGSSFEVHPNGNGTEPLTYTLKSGQFVPSGDTAQTLEAYGCDASATIPVRTTTDNLYDEKIHWQTQAPLLSPSE